MPVTDKQLIPSKFGFDNKTVTKTELVTSVKQTLKKIADPETVKFCNYLIKKSAEGNASFDKPETNLSIQEVNIILKDFGEITGPMYLMASDPRYKSVRFPSGSEKLIDYIMITDDDTEEKFSAKAGQGGKPSIVSVMPIINAMKTTSLSNSERKAKQVLQHIATEEKNGLYYGPLKAAKHLNTSGYKGLLSVLKTLKIPVGVDGIPSPQDLEKAVKGTKTFNNMKKAFKNYFSETGYMMNEAVTKRLFETPSSSEKIWGILHYPITAELVKWLNNDSNGAKKLLTKAASSLSVNQIYLDTTQSSYKYTVKSFSKADFQFGTPSSMPRPVNNRIGFTMVKGMQGKVK